MFLTSAPVDTSFRPITLKSIAEKLEDNKYQNADEWIYEMRLVLSSARTRSSKNHLRSAAAKFLSERFEEEMKTLSPMLSPHTLPLQITEEHFKDFIKSFHPVIHRHRKEEEALPASEIFQEEITNENASPAHLLSEIKLLGSPALILRIAAFIYKIKPSAISFGKELTMMISLLSHEEIIQVSYFVRKILVESAIGKIDPFIQTPGHHPRPLDLICT